MSSRQSEAEQREGDWQEAGLGQEGHLWSAFLALTATSPLSMLHSTPNCSGWLQSRRGVQVPACAEQSPEVDGAVTPCAACAKMVTVAGKDGKSGNRQATRPDQR